MDNGIKKVEATSLDVAATEKEKLRSVFPECFNEGKLDIDKLLSLCGEFIDNDFEKYKFEWNGKSACYRTIAAPTLATLRPCPEESVDFDKTNNLYIEGDNLEVLKILQKAYFRKVKMIYIDPPYNTGNDFVYEDDFKDPLAKYKEVTSQTTKSNPETMGRYHTNWLNMMYPRLRLAANLLRDDGVIFISIDDNEVTNLRKLCDEVFGEENFIGTIIQNKQNAKNDILNIQKNHEYIIAYRKSILLDTTGTKILPTVTDLSQSIKDVFEENGEYYYINDSITTRGDGGVLSARPNLGYTVYYNPKTKDKKAVCDYDVSKSKIATDYNEIYTNDTILINQGYIPIRPPKVRGQLGVWTWSLEKFNENCKDIVITGKNGNYAVKKRTFVDKSLVKNVNGKLQYQSLSESNVRSIWDFSTNEGTKMLNDIMIDANTFNNAKNLDMIKKLLNIVPLSDTDIILDFFSGSATTAHAVMQLNAEDSGNRRFIMVQLPELCDEKSEAFKAGYKNICEIGKERIRRAGQKIKEQNSASLLESARETPLDTGFKVFKLDSSNLIAWDSSPIDTGDTETLFNRYEQWSDRIKKDRSQKDLVYEIMLKLGIPLTYPVTEERINGRLVYIIGEDCLVAVCLDGTNNGIQPEDIETLCDKCPAKIVASEDAFADNVALANAHYIVEDKHVELMLI